MHLLKLFSIVAFATIAHALAAPEVIKLRDLEERQNPSARKWDDLVNFLGSMF